MYKLNRTKFITWICTSCFFEREGLRIKDDLIKGSEFVVTDQDLLNSCTVIPSHLVDGETEHHTVLASECKLYYNPKTKAE
jgi:hypothetical protein